MTMIRRRLAVPFLGLALLGCGPAPGYGPDGRMLRDPQPQGYPQAQQPGPQGYPQGGYGYGGYGYPQQGGYGSAQQQGGYGYPQQGGYGGYPQQGGYGYPQQGTDPNGSSPSYPQGQVDPGAGGSAGGEGGTVQPSPQPIAPDPGAGDALPPPYSPAPTTPEPSQPAPPAAPPQGACTDTCRFARNGECDDGRAGSDTDLCAPGTDCSDCGR